MMQLYPLLTVALNMQDTLTTVKHSKRGTRSLSLGAIEVKREHSIGMNTATCVGSPSLHSRELNNCASIMY